MRNKLIAAAGIMVLGWLVGGAADNPVPLVQARRDAWQLQPLPEPVDGTSRAVAVATSPLWGAEPAAASTAAVPPAQLRWRVAGVFGQGKQGGVLVIYSDASKPPDRMKVGEKLPSGHVIESVDGNQVCIRIGKKLYSFGVETSE